MKDTLKPGAKTKFSYRVPADKTVPHLYPEAVEFAMMPTVFATGFMVGLMEWTCMKVLEPHLDPGEGSLGVKINVSHVAATVPGQTVTVEPSAAASGGRRATFHVRAHDGIDMIGEGTHERYIVPRETFEMQVNRKAKLARVAPRGASQGISTDGRSRDPPVQHQLRASAPGRARRAAAVLELTARSSSASIRTSVSCIAAPRSSPSTRPTCRRSATDRLDYVAPMNQEHAFCLAAERLLGLEVPRRAQLIRVLYSEIGRHLSHLLNVTTQAMDVGALTPPLGGSRSAKS